MTCCTPAREGPPEHPAAATDRAAGDAVRVALRAQTAVIPGGKTEIGTDTPYLHADGEAPRRSLRTASFRMSRTAITNVEFATFIADTGYETDAQRFGWSFVFHHHIAKVEGTQGVAGAEWWRRIDSARWDQPTGPGSTLVGREGEPVTHVSWNDAVAFANWAGGRLPTEAEWEHAARGGLERPIYPWGDRHPDDDTFFPCNIWQGEFPVRNTAADGYEALAPALSFEPNGYGLYNMSGNCWEWTADTYRVRSLSSVARAQDARAAAAGWKVLKGGSFLCHRSYCHRYRIAARTGNTPDSTTGHAGFRIAFDI